MGREVLLHNSKVNDGCSGTVIVNWVDPITEKNQFLVLELIPSCLNSLLVSVYPSNVDPSNRFNLIRQIRVSFEFPQSLGLSELRVIGADVYAILSDNLYDRSMVSSFFSIDLGNILDGSLEDQFKKRRIHEDFAVSILGSSNWPIYDSRIISNVLDKIEWMPGADETVRILSTSPFMVCEKKKGNAESSPYSESSLISPIMKDKCKIIHKSNEAILCAFYRERPAKKEEEGYAPLSNNILYVLLDSGDLLILDSCFGKIAPNLSINTLVNNSFGNCRIKQLVDSFCGEGKVFLFEVLNGPTPCVAVINSNEAGCHFNLVVWKDRYLFPSIHDTSHYSIVRFTLEDRILEHAVLADDNYLYLLLEDVNQNHATIVSRLNTRFGLHNIPFSESLNLDHHRIGWKCLSILNDGLLVLQERFSGNVWLIPSIGQTSSFSVTERDISTELGLVQFRLKAQERLLEERICQEVSFNQNFCDLKNCLNILRCLRNPSSSKFLQAKVNIRISDEDDRCGLIDFEVAIDKNIVLDSDEMVQLPSSYSLTLLWEFPSSKSIYQTIVSVKSSSKKLETFRSRISSTFKLPISSEQFRVGRLSVYLCWQDKVKIPVVCEFRIDILHFSSPILKEGVMENSNGDEKCLSLGFKVPSESKISALNWLQILLDKDRMRSVDLESFARRLESDSIIIPFKTLLGTSFTLSLFKDSREKENQSSSQSKESDIYIIKILSLSASICHSVRSSLWYRLRSVIPVFGGNSDSAGRASDLRRDLLAFLRKSDGNSSVSAISKIEYVSDALPKTKTFK